MGQIANIVAYELVKKAKNAIKKKIKEKKNKK